MSGSVSKRLLGCAQRLLYEAGDLSGALSVPPLRSHMDVALNGFFEKSFKMRRGSTEGGWEGTAGVRGYWWFFWCRCVLTDDRHHSAERQDPAGSHPSSLGGGKRLRECDARPPGPARVRQEGRLQVGPLALISGEHATDHTCTTTTPEECSGSDRSCFGF